MEFQKYICPRIIRAMFFVFFCAVFVISCAHHNSSPHAIVDQPLGEAGADSSSQGINNRVTSPNP
jgi:hypothetical protein